MTASEVPALALNVPVPPELQWTDTRRSEEFVLLSITVRMLPDGTLAAKAYGRPVAGGRGGYVSFAVPARPELHAPHGAQALRGDRRGGAELPLVIGMPPQMVGAAAIQVGQHAVEAPAGRGRDAVAQRCQVGGPRQRFVAAP